MFENIPKMLITAKFFIIVASKCAKITAVQALFKVYNICVLSLLLLLFIFYVGPLKEGIFFDHHLCVIFYATKIKLKVKLY